MFHWWFEAAAEWQVASHKVESVTGCPGQLWQCMAMWPTISWSPLSVGAINITHNNDDQRMELLHGNNIAWLLIVHVNYSIKAIFLTFSFSTMTWLLNVFLYYSTSK